MAIVNKSVPVSDEMMNFGTIVAGLVSDVRLGKTPAQIVTDAMPALIAALSGLSALGPDTANSVALDNSVAQIVIALKQAAFPNAP